MEVLILGGGGFIGKALALHLLNNNYQIKISTRAKNKQSEQENIKYLFWDGHSENELAEIAQHSEIIINLIGENLAGGRWTKQRKEVLLNSRVKSGTALVNVLPKLPKVKTILQASAVGYYGFWTDEETPVVGESAKVGSDFLAKICFEWENCLKKIDSDQLNYYILRFAPVLGNGGMLNKLIPPFKMYLGGIPGSGKQPISWIYIDDLLRAVTFILEQNNLSKLSSGSAFNLSSPGFCNMEEFIKNLAKVMKKPAIFPIPAFMLKLMYGEMAESTILGGQFAKPELLTSLGFEFNYPQIEMALQKVFDT